MVMHKYESLYKLSPKLYDLGFEIKCKLANITFLLRHSNLIIIHLRGRREYYEEYKKIIEKVGYPKASYITFRSGVYIYNLIRVTKPDIIVETGVLDGFSSRIMLEALSKNKRGRLFSIEISKDVGHLVPQHLRGRWRLVVGTPNMALKNALRKSSKIDIFMHDSNHSYDQMKMEFELAMQRIKEGGIILSDDVYVNNAFIEFANSIGRRPKLISGWTKCFGIIEL